MRTSGRYESAESGSHIGTAVTFLLIGLGAGALMGLMFAPNGHILGEGIDDIAPFTIRGSFDSATNTAGWTKSYIGAHSVEYRGFYDGRTICGNWTLAIVSGSFWIWPRVIEAGETLYEEVEAPLEVG